MKKTRKYGECYVTEEPKMEKTAWKVSFVLGKFYKIKGDVAVFHPNTDLRRLTENRNGWRQICLDVWTKGP